MRFLCLCLAALSLHAFALAAAGAAKRNVLFIVVDDLNTDLGAYAQANG